MCFSQAWHWKGKISTRQMFLQKASYWHSQWKSSLWSTVRDFMCSSLDYNSKKQLKAEGDVPGKRPVKLNVIHMQVCESRLFFYSKIYNLGTLCYPHSFSQDHHWTCNQCIMLSIYSHLTRKLSALFSIFRHTLSHMLF